MALPGPVAVLVLGLAAGLPALARWRRRRGGPVTWPVVRRSLAYNWLALAGIAGVVVSAGAPADLGLRVQPVWTLVDGLLFGFVAFAGTMLGVALVARAAGGTVADPASLVVFEQPLSRRLLVAVTGAVVETTLYYGVALEAAWGLLTGEAGGATAGVSGATAGVVAGGVAVAGVLSLRAEWSRRTALQWLPGAVVLAGVALWARTLLVVVPIRLVYDGLTLSSADADDYRPGDWEGDGESSRPAR